MSSQPRWDKYETALLIETYAEIVNAPNRRRELVEKLSGELRQLAIYNGVIVDSIYRNTNGVNMQLFQIQHLVNKEGGLKNASALFAKMTEMAQADREQFNAILKEAHQMRDIALKAIEQNEVTYENDISSQTIDYSEDRLYFIDNLYITLKLESEANRFGVSLAYLAGALGTTQKKIKDTLLKVEWARYQNGQYHFVPDSNTSAQKYSFAEPQSLAFTKPVSASYRGINIPTEGSWKTVYKEIVRMLFLDYPYYLHALVGNNNFVFLFTGDDANNCKVPAEVSDGVVIELDVPAKAAMDDILALIDKCPADENDVQVTFVRRTLDNRDDTAASGSDEPITVDLFEPKTENKIEITEVVARQYNNEEKEKFFRWLVDVQNIAKDEARQYVTLLVTGESSALFIAKDTVLFGSFSETRKRAAVDTIRKHVNTYFKKHEHYQKYLAALQLFGKYLRKGASVSGNNHAASKSHAKQYDYPKTVAVTVETEMDTALRELYPFPYARLKNVAQVYDDPNGIHISKIAQLINNAADKDTIEAILQSVSWATKVGDKTYSFSKKPNIAAAPKPGYGPKPDGGQKPGPVTVDVFSISDEEKQNFTQILCSRYASGMMFDDIDFDVIREEYDLYFDEKIAYNNSDLQKALCLCGFMYNERLFPAEGVIGSETAEKIYEYIDKSFSQGKTTLYYEVIRKDLDDVLKYCFNLADWQMLREFLKFTCGDKGYFFNETYISKEKNVAIDHDKEVEDFLRGSGKPLTYDEIYAGLPHLKEDIIKKAIRTNSKIINNGHSEYFHIDQFEASEYDIMQICDIIREEMQGDDIAIWANVYKRITTELPKVIENNIYLSSIGMRNVLEIELRSVFTIASSIIAPKGKFITNAEMFRKFAKDNAPFTYSELVNFKKDIGATYINYTEVYMSCVRVDKNNFVPKKDIFVNFVALDKAIGSYMAKDYLPIGVIDSFLAFPNVGHEWNEFLLDCLICSYSREYKILSKSGHAGESVTGVVVKKRSGIDDFGHVCSLILADSGIELTQKAALDYLVGQKVIANKSLNNLDAVLAKAKQLRSERK